MVFCCTKGRPADGVGRVQGRWIKAELRILLCSRSRVMAGFGLVFGLVWILV